MTARYKGVSKGYMASARHRWSLWLISRNVKVLSTSAKGLLKKRQKEMKGENEKKDGERGEAVFMALRASRRPSNRTNHVLPCPTSSRPRPLPRHGFTHVYYGFPSSLCYL